MKEITYEDILNHSHAEKIQEFAYSGADHSYYYNNIGSPLAQYLVDTFTSESLA